jgi:chemotaxis protein histidine kinase CheA/ActR/RegA family two-component response regulator
LARQSLQLWDSFYSLRIVPIRGLFHRLARVAHDAARVEGLQVDVTMSGEDTGVDRAVQDKAFEPLLHLVRNAVGHGIELPADRARAGKPAAGCLALKAEREGNTLIIVVQDDGRGLDSQAIESKARQLGWLAADERPSGERLHQFIFQPGFSTRSQANAISGRGVGMDVVARSVGQLHGTIDLASHPGRGTQVTLRLPARLAWETTLIVRVDGQPLAIPASQVESAQPFEPSHRRPEVPGDPAAADLPPAAIEVPTVLFRDQAIPVVSARETLGIGRSLLSSCPKLVIVRGGSRLIGLVVDAVQGTEDLVIKPLSPLLAGHPLVSGTSLSVNGEVIAILNPSGLERWLNIRRVAAAAPAAPSTAQGPRPSSLGERPAVLVVDDSISVRRGLVRLLHGLGCDVQEVSDGVEALGRLRSWSYAMVVTDLEMPKLDGFALLAEMRRSLALATVPVVVVSTRCDPVTRRRVLESGARGFLAKPVDPVELERTAQPLLAAVGTRAGSNDK